MSTFGATSSARFSNGSTLPSSLESLVPPQDDLFLNDRSPSNPSSRSNTPQPQKHKSTFGNWTGGKVFQFKAKANASADNLMEDKRTKDSLNYTAVADQAPDTAEWRITETRRTNSQPVGDLGDMLRDLVKRDVVERTPPTDLDNAITRSVCLYKSVGTALDSQLL